MKCCDTCAMYRPPREAYDCGTCAYPVPEYLTAAVGGGNFIGHPQYSGTNCMVYRSVVEQPTVGHIDHKGEQ